MKRNVLTILTTIDERKSCRRSSAVGRGMNTHEWVRVASDVVVAFTKLVQGVLNGSLKERRQAHSRIKLEHDLVEEGGGGTIGESDVVESCNAAAVVDYVAITEVGTDVFHGSAVAELAFHRDSNHSEFDEACFNVHVAEGRPLSLQLLPTSTNTLTKILERT